MKTITKNALIKATEKLDRKLKLINMNEQRTLQECRKRTTGVYGYSEKAIDMEVKESLSIQKRMKSSRSMAWLIYRKESGTDE